MVDNERREGRVWEVGTKTLLGIFPCSNYGWQRSWAWDPSAGEPRLVMRPVRYLKPIQRDHYTKHCFRWPWSIGDEEDRDFIKDRAVPTDNAVGIASESESGDEDEDDEEDD